MSDNLQDLCANYEDLVLKKQKLESKTRRGIAEYRAIVQQVQGQNIDLSKIEPFPDEEIDQAHPPKAD